MLASHRRRFIAVDRIFAIVNRICDEAQLGSIAMTSPDFDAARWREAWRGSRPAWGEFAVEIRMEYVGDPPWMDLDNLAKAILDAIKGYVFHDDAQVARLLVERHPGERARITVRVTRRGPRPAVPAPPPLAALPCRLVLPGTRGRAS